MAVAVYTSIDEVPLDVYNGDDRKDTVDGTKAQPRFELATFSAVVKKPNPPAFVMQFHHDIKPGYSGTDVKGAKRAVAKVLGLPIPSGSTPLAGPAFVKHLKTAQHELGLKADGVFGESTLKKMAPYFDRYGFMLYEGYPPAAKAETQRRNAFIAYMMWGYNYRALIAYAQTRPMDHMDDLEYLPVSDDCSEFFTKGCAWAGYRDPNLFGYDGSGWTGTIAPNGKTIHVEQARGGDGALYGDEPNYEHITGFVTSTRVVSQGSPAGPLLLEWDYRDDAALFKSFAQLAA